MDLREWILEIGERKGSNVIFTPEDVARAAFPVGPKEQKGKERWRSQIRSVRAAAIGLARQGSIDILRRGSVADVNAPIKGLVQLRWIQPIDEES